jgi:hypothetical protein
MTTPTSGKIINMGRQSHQRQRQQNKTHARMQHTKKNRKQNSCQKTMMYDQTHIKLIEAHRQAEYANTRDTIKRNPQQQKNPAALILLECRSHWGCADLDGN